MIEVSTESPETQRIIYRCKRKACGHVWAYDYNVNRRKTNTSSKHKPFDIITYYRDTESGRVTSSDEYFTGCPKCHSKFIEGNAVKGTYSDSHKCDSRCMNAKGPDCECQCAGKNHGINHL